MLTMLFGWISFWIGFSIGHDIVLLMGGTGIEGLIIGVISGIISGIIVSLSTYKFIGYLEFQRRHKDRLWKEILVYLQNLSRPTCSELYVKLGDTGKENNDDFIWTFQHLRDKHSNISMNYDLVENHAKELNDELLKDFKKYIEDKMNDFVGKVNVTKLTEIITNIVESIFQKNIDGLDDIEFKTIRGKINIYVGDPNRPCEISSKENEFLSELIDDKDFRCKIKNIQNESKLLNCAFDRFIKNLGTLINRIESYGVDELKGKCDECSFWKIKYQ